MKIQKWKKYGEMEMSVIAGAIMSVVFDNKASILNIKI